MDAGVGEDGIVVGTGPYKAVALVTDSRLELAPNSDYWNGTPKLDHITVRTISDGDTLTATMLDAGGRAVQAYTFVLYDGFAVWDGRTLRLTPAGEAARRETEAMLRAYMVRVIRRMGEENFAAMLDSWRRWDEAMQAELSAPAAR